MITRRETLLGAGAALLLGTRAGAAPAVKGPVRHEVVVSLATQEMRVLLDGRLDAVWPVSTARTGKRTPTGSWSPDFLSRNHRSSLYGGAPMPFSIFFQGNYNQQRESPVLQCGDESDRRSRDLLPALS